MEGRKDGKTLTMPANLHLEIIKVIENIRVFDIY